MGAHFKFLLFTSEELNTIVARLKEQYAAFVVSASGGGSSATYATRSLEEICGQLSDIAEELESRGELNSGQTFSDEELLVFRRQGRFTSGSISGTCGRCDC